MAEISEKFKAMGGEVYLDADKVKAPHTTATDSEASRGEECGVGEGEQ